MTFHRCMFLGTIVSMKNKDSKAICADAIFIIYMDSSNKRYAITYFSCLHQQQSQCKIYIYIMEMQWNQQQSHI